MRASKYEMLIREMPAALQKVYECVPVQEAWTISTICSEMARRGLTKDRRAITGCLDSLAREGLIREPSQGCFQRISAPEAPLVLVPQPSTSVPAQKPGHMDLMSALADRARGLSLELKKLADDIEAAAVAIDEEIAEAGKDTTKLRQLRTLLKELT